MSKFIAARAAGSRAKIALAVLCGLAGVIAANAAGAADGDVPRVVVKYSEASLATDSGVQDLYRRITYAARKVCPEATFGDLSAAMHAKVCQDEAIARAIRQIDNSRLAELHAAHSKNG
jgi:UrcA family protein